MNEFDPLLVYGNLVKLMTYRGGRMTGPVVNADILSQKLNHYEHIVLEGERAEDDWPRKGAKILIVLIAPGSKYASKSADFKKLLAVLGRGTKMTEIIFVSDTPFTNHIKKSLVSYRADNPLMRIEHHEYKIFKIEVPIAAPVPRHEFASVAEIEELSENYYTSMDKMPKIDSRADPVAVWYGVRPGMVVKIYRISETAGLSIAYRYCDK